MNKYFFKISKRSLALIISGVALDLIGESIAAYYGLPLYMDSIGTFIVSIVLGPLAGSLTGVIMNLLTGRFFSYEWLYAIVSIGGAFTVGKYFYQKEDPDSFRIFSASVLTGLVMTVLSTPINVIFNSGMTGNRWGDALSEMLKQYVGVKTVCCVAGELIVNIPDKILTVILLMWLIKFFRGFGLRIIPEEENGTEERHQEKKTNPSAKFLIFALISLLFGLLGSHTVNATRYFDFNAGCADMIYGTDEGLSSSEINALSQTGDGYIWAGAYSGLYRYNGSFFEKADIGCQISNAVCLYTDSSGRLWIGTNDSGAVCYDPYRGDIERYSADDGLPSDSVRAVCEDDSGNIYISTATYLCRIRRSGRSNTKSENEKGGKITVYDNHEDIFNVNSLVNAGMNRICGVTDSGLLFIMKDGVIQSSLECDEGGETFHAAGYATDNGFLAGTTGDKLVFLRLGRDGFEERFTLETGEFSNFNKIVYDKSHEGYFFACDSGLGFIDINGKRQDLSREKFSIAVSDILIDRQDNIWFASSKQGIMKLSDNPFTDLFKKLGQDEKSVNAVMIDGNDIYIGSDDGLIKADRITGEVKTDEVPKELKGARIRHILKDSRGNIWYSTYSSEGLVRKSADGNIIVYNESNSDVLGSRFRFVTELADKRLLIASPDGISFMKDDMVVKTIGVKEGLEVPKVLSAIEEEDGLIRIGTDGGGVYEIKDYEVVRHIGKEEGLMSAVVMKIVPCSGGRIYVASNGLYYHEDGMKVRKLENFPYTNDFDIYIDAAHRAFVLSGAGLYIADEDDILKDEKGYSYSLLNRKCGLLSSLTANAWYAVSGDRIYLCCTEGVFVLDLNDYAEFDSHYQIVLRSVTREDEEVGYENGVYEIPAGPGQICITPAVLNYTISDPLVSMELEGVDTTARIMRQSELESIYYPTLPFGRYRFRVSVLDDAGKTVLKEMVFLIYKEAKLYEYSYFRIYLVINIIILLGIIVWLFAKMGNMAVISRQYEQIREAKEDAEFANQAKSRFLAQMSHEIRTPINAVLGMDEMILRESRDSDIRSYAMDIYKAGNTLLSLINDLLDSSKIESGKMEIVPVEYELSGLIRDLVNMISQRAQAKDIRLEVQVDPDLPKLLYGDDVRLRQVITNILTNAVKYTVTGTIWLRFKGERKSDTLKLHVEVEDTGIGIKEEDIPALFEEYQRIEEGRNRKIEGTGLGMNITMQLLKLMGSKLEVDSIYGKGSKFYFDIEQKIADSARIGEFNQLPASADEFSFLSVDDAFTAEDARILVVDDNAMNRKVLRSLLKPLKVKVSEAAGGAEALGKAEHEKYDIVLMDHMMPEMDGIETMKRMRKIEGYADIPIFALTANAVTGAKEEYIKTGFDGFLSKPVVMDKLEEAIRDKLPKELIHPLTDEEKENLKNADRGPSAGIPDDLPDVEGLDWGYAWIHMPDMQILREGVKTFYEVIELQADRLKEAYEGLEGKTDDKEGSSKDTPFDLYRIQVHAMKSSAATIGIVPLAGVAKMLEFAAKDEDLRTVRAMHEPFIREWISYREKLKGVFGLGLKGEKNKQGDISMLGDRFEELKAAFDILDVDSMDRIMLEIGEYSYSEEIDGLIERLNAAVKDLDEELAGKIIEEIEGKG